MPVAVLELPVPTIARKRWTRKEVEKLEASGAFGQQRFELIEGDLIEKMPKNRPHAAVTIFLVAWLIRIFGEKRVSTETTTDVRPEDNPTSQPEPDLLVFKPTYNGFWTTTPQPKDLALVVEVSDSTLGLDLTAKARLYARAGIREYWVVDIRGRRIVVHRDPAADTYRTIEAYSEEESLAPLESPQSFLHIADILPPR
jgi:Uma2 family endonuclease